MKAYIEQRVLEEAAHVIRTKDNIRSTAKKFQVSKSTVHMDLVVRLQEVHPQMNTVVSKILGYNKAQRHLRGGEATRRKYQAS